ncbi:MAG TPA: histidinol dehydrogenase [Acidimicrobiia bacterium]|jgi:phosphoribosyl-ATP pyrophosphohydrolase/phosphoribosyl-AMP cyclohydrolase/histidinol dehydrogenase|nr:histidinol dehydrogenase [Acidimicrobiia bacterium]
MSLLRPLSAAEAAGLERRAVDARILSEAALIVEEVRTGGEEALLAHCRRLGDLEPGQGLTLAREDLRSAFDGLDDETRDLLIRVNRRIETFARAQRDGLAPLEVVVEGGRAGHRWIPVESVGAYAPGGRHPLPSTVLMTTTPARVAGVGTVWVASPRPSQLTLAAAWVSGADGLLAAGGAQAVAALAFGVISPPCDMVVGPGNVWVTAAKRHLYGEVGIDGLAGPSEILVIADGHADPALVAADLLAQAEHDVDALPALITTDAPLADRVQAELAVQLSDLPTAEVARAALGNGFCVVVEHLAAAADLADDFAPEHLAIHVADPDQLATRMRRYGSIFIGGSAAEAFADYGAGPNHVLPTGGTARFASGLSVLTYMRAATWLQLDRPGDLVADTARLARLEGLEAHARAALRRTGNGRD